MNIKDRIAKIKALTEEYKKKQALLSKARDIQESYSATGLAKLLESELEKAELILGAKDVITNLQKIAERLAELGAEQIMPLADKMKSTFGIDIARQFEHTTNVHLQKALETVRAAKDAIDTAITQVEGKMQPSNDMNQDMNFGSNQQGNMSEPEMDDEDMFGGSDAASGPKEEPLGRAKKEEPEKGDELEEPESKGKKESFNKKGNTLSEKKKDDDKEEIDEKHIGFKKLSSELEKKGVKNPSGLAASIGRKKYGKKAFQASSAKGEKMHEEKKDNDKDDKKKKVDESISKYGTRILETEKLESLLDWLFETSSTKMTAKQFSDFTGKVIDKTIQNPKQIAGWIGEKKYGSDKVLSESDISRSQQIAMAIAKGIDANIMVFGRGNAARVVEQFTSGSIIEGEGENVIKTFEEIYGVSPANYSILSAKGLLNVNEATPMSPSDKQKVTKAVGQAAAEIAKNPNAAKQPATAITSKMNTATKAAFDKASQDDNTSTTGTTGTISTKPKTAGDAVSSAAKKLESRNLKEVSDEGNMINKGGKKSDPLDYQAGDYPANTNKPTQVSKGKVILKPLQTNDPPLVFMGGVNPDGTENKTKVKSVKGDEKSSGVNVDKNKVETTSDVSTETETDDSSKVEEDADGTETMIKVKNNQMSTDKGRVKAKTTGNKKPLSVATESKSKKKSDLTTFTEKDKKLKESPNSIEYPMGDPFYQEYYANQDPITSEPITINVTDPVHNPKSPFAVVYNPASGMFDIINTGTGKIITPSVSPTANSARMMVDYYNRSFEQNPSFPSNLSNISESIKKRLFEGAKEFVEQKTRKSYDCGYEAQKSGKKVQSCPKDLDQDSWKKGWNDAKKGERKEFSENINATNWPIENTGQYKGKPLTNDNMLGSSKSTVGKSTKPKETDESEKPKDVKKVENPKQDKKSIPNTNGEKSPLTSVVKKEEKKPNPAQNKDRKGQTSPLSNTTGKKTLVKKKEPNIAIAG